MKLTRILMGMPVILEVVDAQVKAEILESVFDYFGYIDRKFSTYKRESEISLINRNELAIGQASDDMKTIFSLAALTRLESDGYFEIERNGKYDPSGIVKGWAIYNASEILVQAGCKNFYVDAGGDIQVFGKNGWGQDWRVGIQNPFSPNEIVKVVSISECGIATSGNYVRGEHIYAPRDAGKAESGIVSLTVIGPNVYEADRFATAAFAMGQGGINFIETLDGFEGYLIDNTGLATYTSGFERYVIHDQGN
jgi:FAD:protein FMN transferase